jgi:hypothetical protein
MPLGLTYSYPFLRWGVSAINLQNAADTLTFTATDQTARDAAAAAQSTANNAESVGNANAFVIDGIDKSLGAAGDLSPNQQTAWGTANLALGEVQTIQAILPTINTTATTALTNANTALAGIPIQDWSSGQAIIDLTSVFQIVCSQTLTITKECKVYISATFNVMSKDASTTNIEFYLSRGASPVGTTSRTTETTTAAGEYRTFHIQWYDSPTTVGAKTYRLYARCVEAVSPILKWDVSSCNIYMLGQVNHD